MIQPFEKSITIQAPAASVWHALTNPEWMKRWMGEPEMEIEITTDWQVGNSILVKGFHHAWFENRGIVLAAEPGRLLRYTQLSSLSHLPEQPESYTVIEFQLFPSDNRTLLTLAISNFPTETIFKHLEFYWGATLEILKELVEGK